jgi:hypothetical protein
MMRGIILEKQENGEGLNIDLDLTNLNLKYEFLGGDYIKRINIKGLLYEVWEEEFVDELKWNIKKEMGSILEGMITKEWLEDKGLIKDTEDESHVCIGNQISEFGEREVIIKDREYKTLLEETI